MRTDRDDGGVRVDLDVSRRQCDHPHADPCDRHVGAHVDLVPARNEPARDGVGKQLAQVRAGRKHVGCAGTAIEGGTENIRENLRRRLYRWRVKRRDTQRRPEQLAHARRKTAQQYCHRCVGWTAIIVADESREPADRGEAIGKRESLCQQQREK
jgi:hypothetical protein